MELRYLGNTRDHKANSSRCADTIVQWRTHAARRSHRREPGAARELGRRRGRGASGQYPALPTKRIPSAP
jgi:hypothetical protein